MEKKRKWAKVFLFTALLLCTIFGVAACEEKAETPEADGPEVGTYYYDGENGQYYIDLRSGKEFIFIVKDSNDTGRYVLADGTLTFDFNSDQENVTANWVNDVLTLTYGGETMRFLRKVEYTVTFDTQGGGQIAEAVVWNGRTVAKPGDPFRDGYNFIGWYTDATYSALFDFATTAITKNTTVYAQWEKKTSVEYNISFDLGYDATMASCTTTSGKLFNLASPERDGYAFKGWWISAYEDAEKLTCQYTPATVFTADTTLYAVWQKNGENPEPALSVTSAGASWDAQTSEGKLTVEGPSGFATITKTVGATAGTSEAIDFSSAPAGDYKVTFTVNGVTATRWYRNKALDRVWDFKVVNGQLLVFNTVANAEKYIVTINCGNDEHVHTEFDNGNSTNYNFANCAMQPGGIVFTVYAKADGYADSVASTFVYDRTLDEVVGYSLDSATDTLSWNTVANATGYLVTVEVNGEVVTDGLDVGNRTNISLKEYTGSIKVSVVPKTAGYNTPEATSYSYEKTALAAPSALRITGNVLGWNAVEGATSYEIKVDKKVYTSDTNAFDFGDTDILWAVSSDYRISVRALSADNSSLWSDEFDARYYAMYQTLTYNRNTVSWRPVIGAVKYEVMVNNATKNTIFVEDGSSSAVITLTQQGTNTVAVRFYDEAGESDWVELEVFAYAITLDSRGGSAVNTVYLAVGDSVVLPADSTKLGYEFDGWYNVPGGAAANGSVYTDPYFKGNADLILYANWAPKTYLVSLDNGAYAADGAATQGEAKYNNAFSLPVPAVNTTEKVFLGWYSSPNGKGVRYTDAKGNSLVKWSIAEDGVVLYAYYIDLFEFTKDGDYYQVSGTAGVAQVSNLIIPESYEGIKVVSIADYAFKGYTSLVTVSLPDTIRTIGSEAFDGCTNIVSFEVRTTGEPDPYISAQNGSIIRLNPMTGEYDLEAVPLGVSGTYVIPDGVTKIPQNSFKGMVNVTEVVIPASVKSVLKSAFVSCTNLTTITFLDPAEGEDVLGLSLAIDFIDVNVAKATTTCAAITTINLPARLVEIDQSEYKFYEVYSIFAKLVDINAATGNYYSSIDGVLCNASDGKTGDTILFCPYGKTGTYSVPTQITKIADGAFAGSSSTKHNGLTELVFHGNMLSIGARAFYYNYSVTSITFQASENPLGLSIGDEAFYYCYKVTAINFEEEGQLKTRQVLDENGETITEYYYDATKSCGVISIGKDAFYINKETSLVLPSSLRFIDDDAFRSNTALVNLDLSHISTELVFGERVFNACTGLKSVEFTENVGYMAVNSVFYKCTNLAAINVDASNNYYSSDSDGVLYNKDKTEISYYPDGLRIDYVIPSTVISIGGAVFQGKTNITSMVIPKNVERIGANAFEACSTLKTLTFEQGGGNPLVIGEKAFYNCTAIVSNIVLPERTTEIGDYAFYYVGSSVLTLNEGLETIGEYAFAYMKNIESLAIPSTVSEIGQKAFYYCSAVKSLTFNATPAGTAATPLICGNYVFGYMSSLGSVVLPERLQYISAYMFYYDKLLLSVTVPTSVGNTYVEEDGKNVLHRGIESNAFYYCSLLNEVKFVTVSELEAATGTTVAQEDIKGLSFGEQVFYYCTALKTLNFPNRLAGIDAYGNDDVYSVFQLYTYSTGPYDTTYNTAFNTYANGGRAGIQTFTVEEGGDYSSYDGVLYIGDEEIALLCPLNRAGQVHISAKATTIAPSAFRYCTSVTEVIIEDPADPSTAVPFTLQDTSPINATNTSAGTFSYIYATNVFFACTSLKSVSFPARLTYIGDYAFYNGTSTYSTALETVTFADGCQLTEIGDYAFQATPLTEIVLPANVEAFGVAPFSGCTYLKAITLSEKIDKETFAQLIEGCSGLESVSIPENNPYLQEVEGIIYDSEVTTIVYCPAAIEVDVYVIPATVTTISERAFYNIKGIKKVIFEESEAPLSFGDRAFYLSGLEEIVLPARTVYIDEYLFWQCYSLTSVSFEEGFNADLGSYIFQECSALENIVIPYTVQAIGDYVFDNCTSLLSVTFEDTAEHPSRLQLIGDRTFYGCTLLKEIVIPNSVVQFGATGDPDDADYYFAKTTTTHGGYNFYNCLSLTSVKLSDNIPYLGYGTFYNCSALTNVTLPSNLLGIGSSVFRGCTQLTSIVIPDSVTSLGGKISTSTTIPSVTTMNTFYGCSSLQSVTLPKDLDYIPGYAFRDCTSLQTISVPASVEGIGPYAFYGCSKLSSVTFGSDTELPSLSIIGTYAFAYCTLLTSFTFPQSVTSVGASAFLGCTNLSRMVWNGGDIGASAFKGVTALTTFEFGPAATTTSIGTSAFESTSLTSITLPASVTSLGQYAFRYCYSLETFEFPATLTEMSTYTFYNCTALRSVTFADGFALTTIPDYTFYGCSALTSVTIPNTIETIGNHAFRECSSLQAIAIPANVTGIGYYAFYKCTGLESLTFEENSSLAKIGYYAFEYCSALTSVELPDSLTQIGGTLTATPTATTTSYVFAYCTLLESVKLPDNAGFTMLLNYTFYNCPALKTVTYSSAPEGSGNRIPDSVTTMGTYMFYKCTSLEQIDLNAVPAIGNSDFYGCSALKDVKMSQVETIGTYAFYGCSSLTSVDAGNVKTIGTYAFRNCVNLKTVYLDKIESIGANAVDNDSVWNVKEGSSLHILNGLFYNDTNVVIYNGTAEEVTIPAGITTINDYAFQGNTTLKKINLPESLTSIGSYAFSGCTALTEISIPDNVTFIGAYAFNGCTALTTVNINRTTSDLERICNYAFDGCTLLQTITLPDSLTILGGTATATTFTYTSVSYVFRNCVSLTSINIPDSLAAIGTYTFDGCTNLATVTFGGAPSLAKIGSYAFRNCESLTGFAADGLTLDYVNMYAFQNCSLLASIDLSEVTYIGSYAFQNCAELGAVDLSKATTISTAAFQYCSKLTYEGSLNVTLLNANSFEGTAITSVVAPLATTLYARVFADCTSLESVTLSAFSGSTLYTYYNTTYTNQFAGCTALTTVSMPLVQYIANSMFSGCINLASFDDFSNVKYVYPFAFDGCLKLNVDVSMPSATYMYNSAFANSGITSVSTSATTLYSLAFENCPSLKSVELTAFLGSSSYVTGYITSPTSLTASYYGQFRNCTALESVSLPKAKYIASYMFSGCTSLSSLDLSANKVLLGIGDYAFEDCSSLTALDFSAAPLAQTTYQYYDGIGAYAFANCTNLTTVSVKTVANIKIGALQNTSAEIKFVDTAISVTDDIVYNSTSKVLLQYRGTATDYTIPGDITTVAGGAFAGNTTLQTINTNAVTTISASAFEGCTALTTVSAPKVINLYSRAFADCTALTSVSFPLLVATTTYNTTHTGQFSGCTSLSSVSFPALKYVAGSMFKDCSSLTSFDFSLVTYVYPSAFENSGLTGDVTIPLATYIYGRAFAECAGITSVTASKLVTYLYSEAFADCTALKTVSLPVLAGSTTYYNTTCTSQFVGCTALTTFSAPALKYIAASMFEGCENLSNLGLTNGLVLYVYSNAFKGCKNVTSFDFSATTYVYGGAFEDSGLSGDLVLPKATGIYARAFANCTGITSVTLSAFVGNTSYTADSTSNYTEQFIGCTGITEVTLTKATYIAGSMFKDCTELVSVDASLVTCIYESAFEGCTKLSDFDLSNVQKFYGNAFKNCTSLASANLESCTYIVSNAFAGWTAEQTIYAPNFAYNSLSDAFKEYWARDCQATVVWGDTQE